MNKYSKNTLVWSIVTVIYFVGMVETIYQGYAGWIPVLLFVPFIISLAYTWINARDADIFMWHEDEYK
ncbi:hypothetical protein [Aerococcus viridans]|uniref:hypothetical protein n=1 Tax=Aerococcus TaxID=1375 RepID=UPI003B21A5AC